jgi:uncharacterized membrane protein
MRKKWILLGPLAMVAFVAFVALGGWVVALLWNWLLPPLFGWRAITFWQALGLLALCRILFGGLGMGRSQRSSLRQRMRERWEGMTAEEREVFRQRMLERCGFEPYARGAKEKPTGGS